MDNKNDNYYIEKLLNDLNFIVYHTKNITLDDLKENEVLMDSMMFRTIQISENSKKLTDEYKKLHSNVPWNLLYGLRNKIVHDYGNVKIDIFYDTLKYDIPELIELINKEE